MGVNLIWGWIIMVDQRKLRGYVFLLDMGRIAIEDVPEPYRSEIEKE